MARITTVRKRTVGKRGPQSMSCATCHQPIEYGQPYKWFKAKRSYGGVRYNYHPDCHIPPSHRTTSRMGTIYDAQESFDPGETIDDIESALSEFAQTVRDVAEEYRESASNIEEGFGHSTYQSEELAEKAETLDSWADDLESVDLDTDEPETADDETPDDTDQQREAKLAETIEAWLEEQREKARDAVNECPV
jgi:hypothetical protein